MTQTIALDIMKSGYMTIIRVAGPILLISLVVGLIISILQATTQIQEQTLSFVPKMLAIFAGLIILGNFMMSELIGLTKELFSLIPLLG